MQTKSWLHLIVQVHSNLIVKKWEFKNVYNISTFLNLTKHFFRRFRIRIYRTNSYQLGSVYIFKFPFDIKLELAKGSVCTSQSGIEERHFFVGLGWRRGFVSLPCLSWSKCSVCTALQLCGHKVEANKINDFFSSHTFLIRFRF